ncbi:signal peptidase II [Natroniella acetigena]|uniref:signal peptidase II n=1 Tax=Natroniella acetigena TaxID=52004 RepID=UPI00200A31B9|nr:signal peptidase II [Natroniella acetigena]MCK8826889.1 signal peptidase II [Natroniella acetigena]
MEVLISLLLTVILDQGTKYLVMENLDLYQSIPIIEDIFHLTYIRNQGAAFGILQGRVTFLIIVTVLAIILLIVFYNELPVDNRFNRLILGLGIGGALGNLIDRVRLGYVVDFFDFRVWPVFNIADVAIVITVSIFSYWVVVIEGK